MCGYNFRLIEHYFSISDMFAPINHRIFMLVICDNHTFCDLVVIVKIIKIDLLKLKHISNLFNCVFELFILRLQDEYLYIVYLGNLCSRKKRPSLSVRLAV